MTTHSPSCCAATRTSCWGGRRPRSCSPSWPGRPKLVEDVVPNTITLGELVRVLRQLLRENLSVRDLRTVLEGVADAAARSKDTSYLVENVRRRLFRQVTSRVADSKGVVHALTLDRPSEEQLRRTLGQSDGEATLAPDVATARRLVTSLEAPPRAWPRRACRP